MADKEAEKEKAPEPAKKKGGSKIILFTIVGVIILGGGGAGAFFMMRRGNATAEGAEAKPVEKKKVEANKGGVVTFEPFVVNLADGGGSRFLRLTVRLVVDEEAEAEKIQKSEVTIARARSEILEVLTEQTSDKLVTAEGKSSLKKLILEHASKIVEPTKVSDVLFSDFVVQF
jgi:flagellar FliL protein